LLIPVLTLIALLMPTATRPAQAAINDTPTPFASDGNIEQWSVGAGLVYWANNCFGDEFNPIAELRRKPAAGGPQQLVQAVDTNTQPDRECGTFSYMLSSGEGLFYLEEDSDDGELDRIMRMPLGVPFVPGTVNSIPAPDTFVSGRAFVEAGDYLYWPVNFTNKIFRTRKDGSGPIETVADTNPGPLDMIVVGTTVYWTDDEGVFGQSIACDPLPCGGGAAKYSDLGNGTTGAGLVYREFSGFFPGQGGFTLFWVQRTGNNYKIVYRSCSFIALCYAEFAPDPPNPTPAPPPPSPFYTASPGRIIGDLVLADGNIFWTESDATSGEIFRKAVNAAADVPPDNIATAQLGIDQRLFVDGGRLFFARNAAGAPPSDGIYTLSLSATAIVRDFSLEAFEVTQGIQNLANDVPLVAEKTTYVRAYGRQVAGPNTTNVEAHLIGMRDDVALPGSPLKPVNGVRALVTNAGFDRARLQDGWYFLLPESWTTAGNIKLQLVVDPRPLHNDPNLGNNVLPAVPQQFNFQSQPPVCVVTVPVRTHTPKPSVYDPNVGIMVSNFDRRWPVPETWIYRDTSSVEELEICTWYGVPYPCFGPYELEDGWGLTNGIPDRDKVIVSLWTRAQLSFNPDACDDIGAPVHHMGIVHPDANNGGAAGYASTVSNQSWVQLPDHDAMTNAWDNSEEGSTMAQELAHNHDRKHVNCNNPDDIDTGYPYPPCQIAEIGPASHYGFDIASKRPIEPNDAADFMSYASDTWVSDYTWKALLGKFAASSAVVAPLEMAQGEQVFVTGMVDGESPRGEITSLLILPAETLPPATRQMLSVQAAGVQHNGEPHIAYVLRLLDPNGGVVLDQALTLLPLDDHVGDGESHIFNTLFAKPASAVAQIQLLADGTAVHTITAGLAAPVVTIQQPVAGAVVADDLTVQWTATDADPADRLKFTLQYSHDNGASWHTLGINLPSTPDPVNTFTLADLGSLHGSAPNEARIRVLATDGYNTTIAMSEGFTVPNRPPDVFIYAPVNGATLPGGQAVVLQGAATDPEDGGLDSAGLTWHVDGVNRGTGSEVVVDGLASAGHNATLAGTDANNQTVTTTVNFALAPLSVPLAAAPTLDGKCSDATYTASINVPLSAYADATQANVQLLRSNDYLWVCFYGLKPDTESADAFVALQADIDNSRDALAQATDAIFIVGENGDVLTQAGNGAGDFVAPGPGGLQGQVFTDMGGWSAELRIEKGTLGGWGHLINLAVGHHSFTTQNLAYAWPYAAQMAKPNTWSAAALGVQPLIGHISPSSAPSVAPSVASVDAAFGPSLPLTVTGSNLVSGTVVLWNGTVLPTTFVTTTALSAQVTDTLLTTAGIAQVTVRSPDNIVSNPVQFIVEAPAPVITSLSPASATQNAASFTLVVNGSNFAPDAKILWNGLELTTQFVSANQVSALIDTSLLPIAQVIGVSVGNPTPSVQISQAALFEVLPGQLPPVDPPVDPPLPGTVQSFMPSLYK
jgi:hypothetical protein